MKFSTQLVALSVVCPLLAAVPAAATEPAIYGAVTGYAGAGKHPKTGVSGLILDAKTSGLTFLCYRYTVITNSKIKGQVSAVAERISGNRVEKIATFRSNKVQAFDPDQVPPGADNQCSPEVEDVEFNIGSANDCVEMATPLAKGDIIRWTYKFKKGAKLKGRDSIVQVFGSVLPLSGLAGDVARAEQVFDWMEALATQRPPHQP